MAHSITTVLFDLNETLIHQVRTEQSHIASTYGALAPYKWDITFESFEAAWNEVHGSYAKQFQEGRQLVLNRELDAAKEKLREPWYRENIEEILKKLEDFPVSNRLIEKITWAFQDSWVGGLTMPPENRGVLEQLANEGYQLGIVTNFQQPDIIPDILAQFEIQEFFDPVIISATLGYRKPHPAIFQAALAELADNKLDKPGCVAYVGDNPEDDVEGASLAGLRPILIAPEDRHAKLANPVRIRRLAELPPVLSDM